MHNLLKASGIVTPIAFAAFAPSAVAQEVSFKQICQSVGSSAPEPLGDREGHMISVDRYSCRMDSGPMSGGLVTGDVTLDWDKTNAVVVMGSAVVRKPGGFAAYQDVEGKVAMTIVDGKVTGLTGSGKMRWIFAMGSAAPFAGKMFDWKVKSTGAGQWEADATSE